MIARGASRNRVLRPQDLGFGPLFWTIREALVVVDADTGEIVLWNPAAASLFGYAADEAVGMPIDALVPEALRPQYRAGLHRYAAVGHGPLIDAGEPVSMPALRKDGAEIVIEFSLAAVPSPPGRNGASRYVRANIRDVTDRWRATAANAQLAAIVESTDDAIVGVDTKGFITTWNPGAERLYGYSAAETVGRSIAMLVPADLMPERQTIIDRVLRGERIAPFETERLTKGGQRIQVSLSVAPMRGPDGAIIGAASIARDITERRRAEEDRARLAAIVESTEEAIIAIDREGRITAWNPGAERLYGYTAAEAIGQPASMLVIPELAAERQAKLSRVLQGERTAPYETERLTKAGQRVRVVLSASPIRGPNGTVIGAASIARDMSALRAAEARLREIETQYRILVDRMPAATYIEELDEGELAWTTRFVSPQIETMLGYPVDVWLNDPQFFPTILYPDDRERVLAEDARTEKTRETYRVDYRMFHRDGRVVWVHDEAVLVPDEPQYWLGFMLDITEQKQLESERAAVFAVERETAHRLEELDAIRADFTRMVAHELGSPIAAIRRSADLLAAESLTTSQQWALDVIQKEVGALRSLVDDVVAIATIERDDFTVDLQCVSLARLLTEAYTYGRTMPGACPITVNGNTAGEVRADPERIAQVLRNLLNNSALYSPPGTPITLSATRRGGRVRIEVSDLGPGISQDDLHRIFEKFGRGRNAAAGNVPGGGLGLFLSRRIIQAHGSDLTVVSSPGRGATFAFALEIAP